MAAEHSPEEQEERGFVISDKQAIRSSATAGLPAMRINELAIRPNRKQT